MAKEIKRSRFDPTPRTRGRKWMQMRELWLTQNPLCAECLKAGRVTLATEVDHKIPLFKGGADARENLNSLCADHHRIKTNEDMGYKAARAIGLDGAPEGWT